MVGGKGKKYLRSVKIGVCPMYLFKHSEVVPQQVVLKPKKIQLFYKNM